jgi:hypothetical protein
MGMGGENIDMVRRREDAAERLAPRDRDEVPGGPGDALGALGTFVGAVAVLLRRVTPRRFRVAPASTSSRLDGSGFERYDPGASLYGNPSTQGGTMVLQRVMHSSI